jgi:hypothetical protein
VCRRIGFRGRGFAGGARCVVVIRRGFAFRRRDIVVLVWWFRHLLSRYGTNSLVSLFNGKVENESATGHTYNPFPSIRLPSYQAIIARRGGTNAHEFERNMYVCMYAAERK